MNRVNNLLWGIVFVTFGIILGLNALEITNINILVDEIPSNAKAKIRYRYDLTPCTIEKKDKDTLLITFNEPVKSATIGQSLVIYDNNVCIGGGKITNIK